jgi:hypothetical protein
MWNTLGDVVSRAARAAVAFLAHLFLAALAMIGVWGTEQAFHALFKDGNPKFFDYIPVKWFFDAGEVGILIVFVIFGTIEAIAQLRGQGR